MKSMPNWLSLSRILLSFGLLFVEPLSLSFYVIYIACGLSDMLDGFIARKTGTTSNLGAKIDSLADLVMVGILLVILLPIINPEAAILLWVIFIGVIRLAAMIVAQIKYNSFASLHTYGNKATGLVLFLFPLLLSFSHTDVLMYIICVLASISAIEELLIHLTSDELLLNRKGLLERKL
ncbi:phosphatidylglycerophosphate synthase [Desulfitobacterium dehalogenans ATCC 51507]|uniref:Phosphatidylglycerophosphate synthase n=2 Tax=Desulfitobacterium dehalogenans TaxID=36854 RepID=I4AC64_DESDJ|nr:CDP-alcohol phosphatidyltransferase family protein [Desulfitobacterium dehalogenans]AAL08585.1 putative CDP-alcohol phosphatidyltransferase [Desulfitobacterium dehalogenans]AFM01549.1 phosphatidylglycerophosphate synthase [Desulfitobacterium dehalogenans ATCC 51507]